MVELIKPNILDELDILDRRIMYELDLNARVSASQLAKKLRKSKETINFRINRLLSEKYLKGFYAVFNISRLGWFYYKLYIKFNPIPPEKEKEIIEYIRDQNHIAYLASTEGRYDCIFLLMARDSTGMLDFLYPFMTKYGEHIREKDLVTFLTVRRLNERFLYAGEKRQELYYPFEIGTYKPDKLDEKILEILASEARASLTEIAKRIGSNPKVVKYRIKKLEKDGVILGYASAPNFDKLGLQFIQINMALNDPAAKASIIEYFDSTNKCLFVLDYLGKYDLAVEIHLKNHDELNSILDGFRKRFVGKYSDYDVATITKEYVVIWGPFAKK
ncbi:TPA: Lrp/AsnC family transcriptional regulator [Candidatus Micrarchaeota archaeon]|nr:Lrp/AsnC family transcriptional regulator [Candidatus Micrarchaeota archaeon]